LAQSKVITPCIPTDTNLELSKRSPNVNFANYCERFPDLDYLSLFASGSFGRPFFFFWLLFLLGNNKM
jgi:hypothetical protein